MFFDKTCPSLANFTPRNRQSLGQSLQHVNMSIKIVMLPVKKPDRYPNTSTKAANTRTTWHSKNKIWKIRIISNPRVCISQIPNLWDLEQRGFTLLKFNSSPREKWWLEDYFPFRDGIFSGPFAVKLPGAKSHFGKISLWVSNSTLQICRPVTGDWCSSWCWIRWPLQNWGPLNRVTNPPRMRNHVKSQKTHLQTSKPFANIWLYTPKNIFSYLLSLCLSQVVHGILFFSLPDIFYSETRSGHVAFANFGFGAKKSLPAATVRTARMVTNMARSRLSKDFKGKARNAFTAISCRSEVDAWWCFMILYIMNWC